MARPSQTELLEISSRLIETKGGYPWISPFYRERNLIVRFFNKLEHFRGIATRYDKLARNFLTAIQLVAATILLN